MTKLITESTFLKAWLMAAKHLLSSKVELNLILHVDSPALLGPNGVDVLRAIDSFYLDKEMPPTQTVAETIFPAWEYRHRGTTGVYDVYLKEFDRVRSNNWGSYAERMLRRRTANGQLINPLKVMVEKMRRVQRPGHRKYKSCYELDVSSSGYELPLYDSGRDRNRLRGGPCLSHLSFSLLSTRLHLVALYRSHEYCYKVPGNLLGLTRLMAFVANEVGVEVGSLVIHSSYATYDGSKRGLKQLSEKVENIMEAPNVAQKV